MTAYYYATNLCLFQPNLNGKATCRLQQVVTKSVHIVGSEPPPSPCPWALFLVSFYSEKVAPFLLKSHWFYCKIPPRGKGDISFMFFVYK